MTHHYPYGRPPNPVTQGNQQHALFSNPMDYVGLFMPGTGQQPNAGQPQGPYGGSGGYGTTLRNSHQSQFVRQDIRTDFPQTYDDRPAFAQQRSYHVQEPQGIPPLQCQSLSYSTGNDYAQYPSFASMGVTHQPLTNTMAASPLATNQHRNIPHLQQSNSNPNGTVASVVAASTATERINAFQKNIRVQELDLDPQRHQVEKERAAVTALAAAAAKEQKEVRAKILYDPKALHEAIDRQKRKRGTKKQGEEKKDKAKPTFPCTFPGCLTISSTRFAFNAHKKLHDEPVYRCLIPECQAAVFITEEAFRQHLLTHGPQTSPNYSISQKGCQNQYCTAEELLSHMETCVVQAHRCPKPDCEASFSSANALVEHLKAHSGERPFLCSVQGCWAAFAKEIHMLAHVRTHTGDHPHKCNYPGCTESFKFRYALSRHQQSAHRMKTWSNAHDGSNSDNSNEDPLRHVAVGSSNMPPIPKYYQPIKTKARPPELSAVDTSSVLHHTLDNVDGVNIASGFKGNNFLLKLQERQQQQGLMERKEREIGQNEDRGESQKEGEKEGKAHNEIVLGVGEEMNVSDIAAGEKGKDTGKEGVVDGEEGVKEGAGEGQGEVVGGESTVDSVNVLTATTIPDNASTKINEEIKESESLGEERHVPVHGDSVNVNGTDKNKNQNQDNNLIMGGEQLALPQGQGQVQVQPETESVEEIEPVEPRSRMRKKYVCDYADCGRSYALHASLSTHKKQHIADRPILPSASMALGPKNFRCAWEGCGRSFVSAKNLQVHLKSHVRPLKRGNSIEMYPDDNDGPLDLFPPGKRAKVNLGPPPEPTPHGPFKCAVAGCGTGFLKVQHLRAHQATHCPPGENSVMCEVEGCEMILPDKNTLTKHEMAHVGATNSTSVENVFECPHVECRAIFPVISHLDTHRAKVHGEKVFSCSFPACALNFDTANQLKKHMARHELANKEGDSGEWKRLRYFGEFSSVS